MYLVDFICVIPRQAREIVLRYEGRLTRTRGYQTAGADVRPPAFYLLTFFFCTNNLILLDWRLEKQIALCIYSAL